VGNWLICKTKEIQRREVPVVVLILAIVCHYNDITEVLIEEMLGLKGKTSA
jgi:hypothetical protein